MRPARRFPALLALAAALAAPRAARGEGAAPGEFPVGIPVALDGVVASGEWDDALAVPLGTDGAVLHAKQYRGTLLLAVSTTRPWPWQGRLVLYTVPGGEEGGQGTPGAAWIDLEPRDHARAHAIVAVREARGWADRTFSAVVRFAGLETRAGLEAAVPLAVLGVAGRTPPPLRWCAVWETPHAPPTIATAPAGLVLKGPANRLPPDLESAGRWAVASRWTDVDGPGTFPKDAWDAMVAADRALAGRGVAAHAMAIDLQDAPNASGSHEARKVDRAIEEGILGNLRFVARTEPLTAADVRAMATGLWRLNRCEQALALLESAVVSRRRAAANDAADDALLEARIASDAEQFERAALAFERVAGQVPEQHRPPYVSQAAHARDVGAAFEAESRARAEDAARGDLPLAVLRTTRGEIVVRLLEDDAPQAVANFVHLAEDARAADGKPFYAGTYFHRDVPNALVQGGDPTSRTAGCDKAGPGGCDWTIDTEKATRHRFFRGAVGFALDPQLRARSQFFVTTGPLPRLHENGYPLFGTVVAGMDVVDRLEVCDVLLDVRIFGKRAHAYEPKKHS